MNSLINQNQDQDSINKDEITEQIINVMIVDDHAMIREGIKQLIEFDECIEVIYEAKNGRECLEILNNENNKRPDVLLLDLNMPEVDGIGVLESLLNRKNEMKVIILTVHNEVEYLLKVQDYDINGYILKDSPSKILIEAINSVINCYSDIYIDPNMKEKLEDVTVKDGNVYQKFKSLTSREKEILMELSSGLFNREIALKLNISERTVKNHISNIFKKLEVADRTQAALIAIKMKLVIV